MLTAQYTHVKRSAPSRMSWVTTTPSELDLDTSPYSTSPVMPNRWSTSTPRPMSTLPLADAVGGNSVSDDMSDRTTAENGGRFADDGIMVGIIAARRTISSAKMCTNDGCVQRGRGITTPEPTDPLRRYRSWVVLFSIKRPRLCVWPARGVRWRARSAYGYTTYLRDNCGVHSEYARVERTGVGRECICIIYCYGVRV